MPVQSKPIHTQGAIIRLPEYAPVFCEARPGWPYLRFTLEGRFLAIQEDLQRLGQYDRALEAGRAGIACQPGWRRLNLSPHGEWLACQQCDSGATEIWKYPEAERLHRFYLPEQVTRAEFRPDGAQLACLCGRDVPGIWCWIGKWRTRRLGDAGRVFSFLSYSADSRFLAAAGDDRKIYLWDAHTLESVAVSPQQDALAGLSLNEDGSWLASGAGDEVRIWETRGGLFRSLATGAAVWRTFFSPKGDLLAVVHHKAVQMWNARTGELLGALAFSVEHENFQVAFRPDGAAVAWGNSSRGSGGPLIHPPLGFYSPQFGAVLTNMSQAHAAAPWAF
jgi:hypothetical protein